MTVVRRALVPTHCDPIIFRDALAVVIHDSQIVLCASVVEFGDLGPNFERLCEVAALVRGQAGLKRVSACRGGARDPAGQRGRAHRPNGRSDDANASRPQGHPRQIRPPARSASVN